VCVDPNIERTCDHLMVMETDDDDDDDDGDEVW
jgi:hypothetical protein